MPSVTRRIRRGLAATLVTLLLAVPAVADPEQDAAFATAAFQCAILAAESGKASGYQARASDLANMAMPKARATAEIILQGMAADKPDAQGPLSTFVRNVSPDFMAALFYSKATTDIEDVLPKAAEATESYEAFKLHKEIMAETEYGKRNCGLLKP